jgi:hypothetical protein
VRSSPAATSEAVEHDARETTNELALCPSGSDKGTFGSSTDLFFFFSFWLLRQDLWVLARLKGLSGHI